MKEDERKNDISGRNNDRAAGGVIGLF